MKNLLYSTCIVTALGVAALSSIAIADPIADPMKAETNHVNQQMKLNMAQANIGIMSSNASSSNNHNHDHDHHDHDHDHDHHDHDHDHHDHDHDHHDHDHDHDHHDHNHDHHDHPHHDHHHHYHYRLVDKSAGPIWNNADAPGKCYPTCKNYGGQWDGQWRTVQGAQNSVCECKIYHD